MADQRNTFPFTERRIEELPAPTGRASWHYDETLPGLAVTVSPNNKKCLYVILRGGGRSRRIKLGRWPSLSVAQARTAARAKIGDAAKGAAVWERAKADQRTVDDLFNAWADDYAAPKKLRTLPRRRQEYARLLQKPIGKLAITALKRDMIRTLIAKIQAEGGVGPAKNAHVLLSGMLSLAVDNGWLEASPMAKLTRPDAPPRERYLQPGEVAAFIQAVEGLQHDLGRHYILMLIHTGQRKGAVARMRWDEIDGAVWKIPAASAKQKRQQTVPLTARALEILEQRRGCHPVYVFPSPKNPDKPYVDSRDAWVRVVEASGLSNIRMHDLRRSLGAWLISGGESLKVVQVALGHSDVGTTSRHYSPIEVSQVREAMSRATERMLSGVPDNP
jgi:integrase